MRLTGRPSAVLMVPSESFVALAAAEALRGRHAELLMIDDGNFRLAPPEPEKIKPEELKAILEPVKTHEPPARTGPFYAALYKRGRRR